MSGIHHSRLFGSEFNLLRQFVPIKFIGTAMRTYHLAICFINPDYDEGVTGVNFVLHVLIFLELPGFPDLHPISL